jgi:hypothetical protein
MKKPEVLDLEKPRHRLILLRAYHQLLSEGLSENQAKLEAPKRAFEKWDELSKE